MKVSYVQNSPSFNACCPEIRLGQNVYNAVNKTFPHYSLSKFNPFFPKYLSKVSDPAAIISLQTKLFCHRPNRPDNYVKYFTELFNYIDKFHAFNCHESSLLTALTLKLNGIKNVYTAALRNGTAKVDHVICFFNRDGSEYKDAIKNNQTIIVDTWANKCDFANNVFKEYQGIWEEYIKPDEIYMNGTNGKFSFRDVDKIVLPDEAQNLGVIREIYPTLNISKNG